MHYDSRFITIILYELVELFLTRALLLVNTLFLPTKETASIILHRVGDQSLEVIKIIMTVNA